MVPLPDGPLDGVRVLDFTRFQQGPYATRLLADMGADVLKIERPGGDWDRDLRAEADGFSGFFQGLNRGKRSAVIDIRTPAGVEIVLRMAAAADVVVENFRPGVMDRLGLGFSAFAAVNSRIVYAAGGGWGPDGPRADEPMFDMVGQAVSGVADFNSSADGTPRLATRGYADAGGGVFLALGIVSALHARHTTGRGQRVDASLVGACIGLHTPEITVALNEQRITRPRGRVSPTSGAFRCADGNWLVIAATGQNFWAPLCAALDRPDLLADTRFDARTKRLADRTTLEPMLEEAFLGRDRDEWMLILREHDIPVGPVRTFLDLATDPDVRANGYVLEQPDPVRGRVFMVGHPVHYSDTPVLVGAQAPALGEDTAAELLRAGYDPAQIQQLATAGVVTATGGPSSADSGPTTNA